MPKTSLLLRLGLWQDHIGPWQRWNCLQHLLACQGLGVSSWTCQQLKWRRASNRCATHKHFCAWSTAEKRMPTKIGFFFGAFWHVHTQHLALYLQAGSTGYPGHKAVVHVRNLIASRHPRCQNASNIHPKASKRRKNSSINAMTNSPNFTLQPSCTFAAFAVKPAQISEPLRLRGCNSARSSKLRPVHLFLNSPTPRIHASSGNPSNCEASRNEDHQGTVATFKVALKRPIHVHKSSLRGLVDSSTERWLRIHPFSNLWYLWLETPIRFVSMQWRDSLIVKKLWLCHEELPLDPQKLVSLWRHVRCWKSWWDGCMWMHIWIVCISMYGYA